MPMRAAARRIEQAFIGVILVALFVLGFQTWRQHVAGRNVCRGTHLLAQIEINNHTNVIKESNALILNGNLPKATQDILQQRIVLAVKQLELAREADCGAKDV